MADQIFEIKFHNLFGYKFGRIVDESHNLYNGDEGWITKDEVKSFMDKFLEALNKEHLRRENIQKYKRCLAMASKCRLRARWFGDNAFYKKEQWALQWHKRWLDLAKKFKPEE